MCACVSARMCVVFVRAACTAKDDDKQRGERGSECTTETHPDSNPCRHWDMRCVRSSTSSMVSRPRISTSCSSLMSAVGISSSPSCPSMAIRRLLSLLFFGPSPLLLALPHWFLANVFIGTPCVFFFVTVLMADFAAFTAIRRGRKRQGEDGIGTTGKGKKRGERGR